jgi:hypothetical protein
VDSDHVVQVIYITSISTCTGQCLYIGNTLFRHSLSNAIKTLRVSIISGTGAAIWSKSNVGPTVHHHPQSSRHPCVCIFSAFLSFFKCILEVVFCESVHKRLRFCLHHVNCVKMGSLSFISSRGNTVGDGNNVSFGQNFPVLLSPKFGTKTSHIFTQSP